jgi:hypothetical protein
MQCALIIYNLGVIIGCWFDFWNLFPCMTFQGNLHIFQPISHFSPHLKSIPSEKTVSCRKKSVKKLRIFFYLMNINKNQLN